MGALGPLRAHIIQDVISGGGEKWYSEKNGLAINLGDVPSYYKTVVT